MLKSFLDWFKSEPELKEEAQIDVTQRAASALMVEVVLADTHFSEHEKEHLLETLKKQTGLTTQECIELADIARSEVDHATSLHQFTRHLNEAFNLEEKLNLVYTLWKIAYADGHLDKYEEHIIRRISDLLHLRHSEFIQMKLKAKDES